MFSKNIFEAFPPPSFLSVPFSGMSISDTAVRVIKFKKKNKKLSIDKYTEKYLTPGIISGGQINNKEDLVKIITEIKNDLRLDYVKVSLTEERGYLFTTKIPVVGEEEVKSAIESKIEENVPVPPGELIFDYKIKENREKERLDVVVSALPISVVETYVETIQSAGLEMLSLEIESQAIARTLLNPNDKKTVLIIHFGQGKAALYVVVNRVVHFTSTILFKNESTESLDQLSQEIKRLFAYWHTLKENVGREDRKISEILVCGETVSENVISYISTHNQTKVTLGNVWTNVLNVDEKVPEITFTDSLKYAAAIGLALPSKGLI
jgi:Tfp pilus assembly PilM family ATPase